MADWMNASAAAADSGTGEATSDVSFKLVAESCTWVTCITWVLREHESHRVPGNQILSKAGHFMMQRQTFDVAHRQQKQMLCPRNQRTREKSFNPTCCCCCCSSMKAVLQQQIQLSERATQCQGSFLQAGQWQVRSP